MNDNLSLSDRLTALWREMSKAKSMADVNADFFDIMDTLILSEKIEEEYQRLISGR